MWVYLNTMDSQTNAADVANLGRLGKDETICLVVGDNFSAPKRFSDSVFNPGPLKTVDPAGRNPALERGEGRYRLSFLQFGPPVECEILWKYRRRESNRRA